MVDSSNQTTNYLLFSKILSSLHLSQPPQFRCPELVLGVLNPNELMPIIFNHCLIHRLILDKKYDLMKVYFDKLFESQEDTGMEDKLLGEYSHPKIYNDSDKNKLLERVKRRIERNYSIIRSNYQEYVYIIVQSYHDKDDFVNKLFHIDYMKGPEKFKQHLLKIPNQEFFDKLLEIMCELFSLQFVWHRFNHVKKCFETWKFKREKTRSTVEFAEIEGKFYLFLSKKFSADGVKYSQEGEFNIPEAQWVSEEHKSKVRPDSVSEKVKLPSSFSSESVKQEELRPQSDLRQSFVKIEKAIREKEQENGHRIYELKNEIKIMREEDLLTIMGKIDALRETVNQGSMNNPQVSELQEKNQILQMLIEKQKKEIEELDLGKSKISGNLIDNEKKLAEKNDEIAHLKKQIKEMKKELLDLRNKEEDKEQETQDFYEQKAGIQDKYNTVAKTFVETVLNIIKINLGKETPKVLETQAEQLRKIKDDEIITYLVEKMFPRLIKAHSSAKKRSSKAEESDSDSDNDQIKPKPGDRLYVRRSGKHK